MYQKLGCSRLIGPVPEEVEYILSEKIPKKVVRVEIPRKK